MIHGAALTAMFVAGAGSLGAQRRAQQAQLPCGDVLSFQILLDRQSFSPGEIDGKRNANFLRALTALQSARSVPASDQPDCATWHALGGDTSGSLLTSYVITAKDIRGPYQRFIPQSLVAQARLPSLRYRSVLEMLGERFHSSPALLRQINRATPLAAGRTIKVPAVPPFDPDVKPPSDPSATGGTIVVTRDESSLRVTRADGTLIFFAPVTSGGEYDPLPMGEWKVIGINWHPLFHYNPKLFWDAKATDPKATIKPGPNNPVGVVWIDLNLEHYGIHGTPVPSRIAQSESHGCVRLTNWNAARVASLVHPGMRVVFQEHRGDAGS